MPKLISGTNQGYEIKTDKDNTDINVYTALSSDKLKLEDLDPKVGDLFNIFIRGDDIISMCNNHSNDESFYGKTQYPINSNLVKVAIHSGALYVKVKSRPKNVFTTYSNFFEVQSLSRQIEPKPLVIPQELNVKGVVLSILVENAPDKFPSEESVFTSKSSTSDDIKTKLAIRVANYKVITMFDDMPTLVQPKEYVREHLAEKEYMFSSGERYIGIKYSKAVFDQYFSYFNCANGFFRSYSLFLEVDKGVYGLFQKQDSGCFMIKFDNDIIENEVEFSSITSNETGVTIKGVDIPVKLFYFTPREK